LLANAKICGFSFRSDGEHSGTSTESKRRFRPRTALRLRSVVCTLDPFEKHFTLSRRFRCACRSNRGLFPRPSAVALGPITEAAKFRLPGLRAPARQPFQRYHSALLGLLRMQTVKVVPAQFPTRLPDPESPVRRHYQLVAPPKPPPWPTHGAPSVDETPPASNRVFDANSPTPLESEFSADSGCSSSFVRCSVCQPYSIDRSGASSLRADTHPGQVLIRNRR
jgi:hypothetical protein